MTTTEGAQKITRPRITHQDVSAAGADTVLKDVMGWLKANGDDGFDEQSVRSELMRCFEYNAYNFACNLENRCYWSPDAELVEILDGAGRSYGRAKDKIIEKWVSDNGITVPHSVGDIVTVLGAQMRIVDILAKTAQIVAQPIINGGKNYGEKGGDIINFEDATPCP